MMSAPVTARLRFPASRPPVYRPIPMAACTVNAPYVCPGSIALLRLGFVSSSPARSSSHTWPISAAPPPAPSTSAVSHDQNFHRSRGISRTTAPNEGPDGSAACRSAFRAAGTPDDSGAADWADAVWHRNATAASDSSIRDLHVTDLLPSTSTSPLHGDSRPERIRGIRQVGGLERDERRLRDGVQRLRVEGEVVDGELLVPVLQSEANALAEHVADVGGETVAFVEAVRQLLDRRQRRVDGQAVDVARFRMDEVIREADVRLGPELQQIRRGQERVRRVAAGRGPVAGWILELRSRVGLTRLLERLVLFELIRRTERHGRIGHVVGAQREAVGVVGQQTEPAVGPGVAPDEHRTVERDRLHWHDGDGREPVLVAVGQIELPQRRLLADVVERLLVEAGAGAVRVLVLRAQCEQAEAERVRRQLQPVVMRGVEGAKRLLDPFVGVAGTEGGGRARAPRRVDIEELAVETEGAGAMIQRGQ